MTFVPESFTCVFLRVVMLSLTSSSILQQLQPSLLFFWTTDLKYGRKHENSWLDWTRRSSVHGRISSPPAQPPGHRACSVWSWRSGRCPVRPGPHILWAGRCTEASAPSWFPSPAPPLQTCWGSPPRPDTVDSATGSSSAHSGNLSVTPDRGQRSFWHRRWTEATCFSPHKTRNETLRGASGEVTEGLFSSLGRHG